MTDLAFGVFSRDRFPKTCADGLPLYECEYTFGRLQEAANFEPDEVQRSGGDRKRWNTLYPPKVEAGKGLPKKFEECKKCGRVCLVGFGMSGDNVEVGSRVRLQYLDKEQPTTLPQTKDYDKNSLLSRMMDEASPRPKRRPPEY